MLMASLRFCKTEPRKSRKPRAVSDDGKFFSFYSYQGELSYYFIFYDLYQDEILMQAQLFLMVPYAYQEMHYDLEQE